jgi:transcriptional regulator with XRE-family HTH domain
MTIAEIVLKRRKELGLNRRQLAERIHPPSSPQYIYNIERKGRPMPLRRVATFCKALGISTEEIKKILVRDYENKISKIIKG